jgi:hypothetical protein
MEIEGGEGERRGGKGSSDLHEEAASRCLHAQRKISQVLNEISKPFLPLLLSTFTAYFFFLLGCLNSQETQLSGEFRSSDSVKKASKWDEFLSPQVFDFPSFWS